MKGGAQDVMFWLAVGLIGAATVGLLKLLAGAVRLPSGLERAIAAL